MSIIDTINSYKQQGYGNQDIINMLQEQGISPREINDAMAQSQIKQAVAEPSSNFAQEQNEQLSPEMQLSIINPQTQEQYPEIPIPSPGSSQQLTQQYSQGYGGQEYQQGQEYPYPQESYNQADYNQYSQYAPDTSIITDIAGQLIAEKFTKTEKALVDLVEFKALLNSKVEKIDDRLKKIELVIDQLQMSVIRKSGNQEQNIEDIKSEMKLMQNSFGKIINPLTDEVRKIERTRKHAKSKSVKRKAKKK